MMATALNKVSREAAKWYCLAAEAGNAEAQFHFGLMHYGGRALHKVLRTRRNGFAVRARWGMSSPYLRSGLCMKVARVCEKINAVPIYAMILSMLYGMNAQKIAVIK